jgi:hypothetical protein
MREAAALVDIAPAGDPASGPVTFEAFYLERHRDLYRALWLVTRNRHEAEEIAQDAFLRTTHTESKLTEWWFDPTSHQLLVSRETHDDDAAGGVWTYTVVAAGVTASTDTDHLRRAFITPAG